MFVVLIGVLLLVWGSSGQLESTQGLITTSIGGALLGVGVVDLLSEILIRPHDIFAMKEVLNQFISDPTKLPKTLRLALVRGFVEALSPSKTLAPEIIKLFDQTFASQLASTYRSDCHLKVALEKVKFGEQIVAKATADVDYRVHNITDSPYPYRIPFEFNTVLFKTIALEEHIKITRMSVTDEKGASEDVGQSVGAYSVKPKTQAIFPSKVELVLPQNPSFEIKPRGTITISLSYSYLAQLIDDHVHKMNQLTRNIDMDMTYSDKDFVVEIDTFCIPRLNEIVPKRKWSWSGWFLPKHGICVAWHEP